MITRDFLMRQIHQLVQALAQVVFFRRAGQVDEAEDLLRQTVRDVTGVEPSRLRRAAKAELLALCAEDPEAPPSSAALSSEKAVALADLLREDARLLDARDDPDSARTSRERALWLYEAALGAGGTIPIDLPARIRALQDALGEA